MVETTMINRLLSDSESLSYYQQGEIVTIEDIKRRLFILKKNENNFIPDHFYRLALERDFNDINNIEDLLTNGLSNIAQKYLQLEKLKIIVKENNQNDWQQLITYLPPLVLKMALLHKENQIKAIDKSSCREYYHKNILPNTLYTSIPSPFIKSLDEIICIQKGLNDLHIHLNGSTEIDMVWQDFLTFPDKIYKELKSGYKKSFVREQFEQESHLLDPLNFYNLLRIARRIRHILYDFIFPNNKTVYLPLKITLKQLISHDRFNSITSYSSHPFQTIFEQEYKASNQMGVEGLMYVLVFKKLSEGKSPTIASLFHFYLLIHGLANRLLVHQVHQNGFEQFQKITLNNLREISEKKYHQRFFQMHGNDLIFLKYLEGRFSPKSTRVENIVLIDSIKKGWDIFKNKLNDKSHPIPEFKLVAHFIKQKDNKPDAYIRHKLLRNDTWKRGKVLYLLIKNYPKYDRIISGIDVAASEFDTPPEVFAPTFRALRREYIKIGKQPHFTYHVGEDFFHLISGIRAIYEAVDFLELKENDRIGHATAIGISVNKWNSVISESFFIRKGEWLDNLIFVYYLLDNNDTNLELSKNQTEIEIEIKKLFSEIYSTEVIIANIVRSWKLRKYCPILLLSNSQSDARYHSTFDIQEWEAIQNEPIIPEVKNLIKLYHEQRTRIKI